MEVHEFSPEWKELNGIALAKFILKMSIDYCPPQLEALDKILTRFPADVLVSDPFVFGPYLKSEMGGPPSAMISLTPLSLSSRDTAPYGLGLLPGKTLFTRARNRLLNLIAERIIFRDIDTYANIALRELGLDPVKGPFFKMAFEIPSLVMHISTPAFEYARSDLPEHIHFIGPILLEPNPEFQSPDWWSDLSKSEPVVLVNQGTVAVELDDLVVPTLTGLKDEQMVVIAVPVKEGALEEIPENARAEPFVPFGNLLPHINVMVTNGGYGGTQLALVYGIPLVVAGDTEDKMEVAARVEWAGAGINLRKKRPSAGEVRDAVKEVLANPVYGENARRIQADFAGYDAPTRTAELLEALASGKIG
jgi:UDP:flavonoid glycosyltransferase YjiC (YdhE family)